MSEEIGDEGIGAWSSQEAVLTEEQLERSMKNRDFALRRKRSRQEREREGDGRQTPSKRGGTEGDGGSSSQKPVLSQEQLERIQKNKEEALRKKRAREEREGDGEASMSQKSGTGFSGGSSSREVVLSQEQLERIQKNREEALRRKRAREERERAGEGALSLSQGSDQGASSSQEAALSQEQVERIQKNKEEALRRKRAREEREREGDGGAALSQGSAHVGPSSQQETLLCQDHSEPSTHAFTTPPQTPVRTMASSHPSPATAPPTPAQRRQGPGEATDPWAPYKVCACGRSTVHSVVRNSNKGNNGRDMFKCPVFPDRGAQSADGFQHTFVMLPLCKCGRSASTLPTAFGQYQGRDFYGCGNRYKGKAICDFKQWVDSLP